MKLKTVEVNGTVYAEVRDGLPLVIRADGNEVPFDIAHAVGKIKELSDLRDGMRKQSAELEERVKAFGDLDPSKAREALETIKNLDSKKLLDAGKVEELQRQWAKEAAEREAEREKSWGLERKRFEDQVAQANAAMRKHLISTRFATTKVLERTTLTPDIAEKVWGDNFTVEGDAVVGRLGDSKIWSQSKPGELADFDEALDQLIDKYPNKERILRGSGSSGSGATGSTRAAGGPNLDNLPPQERLARGLAQRGAPN